MRPADSLTRLMSLWELLRSGGFIMVPLVVCSVLVWVVILERAWFYRSIGQKTQAFFHEGVALLLRGDHDALKQRARAQSSVPLAQLSLRALERLDSKEPRLRRNWKPAAER